MDSGMVGKLRVGESVKALETRMLDNGTVRVRFERGWVSTKASSGAVILKKTDDGEDPGQGMAAAAPSACAAAVGFHQTVMGANARIGEDTLLAERTGGGLAYSDAVVLTAAPVAYHTEEKVRRPARTVRYCQLTPCPRCHNNTDALRVFVCLAMG